MTFILIASWDGFQTTMNAEGFSFRAINMTLTSTILPSISGVYKCTWTIRKRNYMCNTAQKGFKKDRGSRTLCRKITRQQLRELLMEDPPLRVVTRTTKWLFGIGDMQSLLHEQRSLKTLL